MLFDWLVTGQVLPLNPAHAVRGPKYVVKKGKTPVLNADEARTLLDSIPVVIQTTDPDGQVRESADLVGLRDRALIGVIGLHLRAHQRRFAYESGGLLCARPPRLGAAA
jgi:site-specific recombinase XerC